MRKDYSQYEDEELITMVQKQDRRAFNELVIRYDSKILNFINELLKKIPFLRTIYSAIGQMTETFTDRKKSKKSVVLVEYPRKGSWAVGFATKDNKGEITNKTNKKLVNVFVPTTPNPTSGVLLMFPKDEIIFLDMSFEEASKFIVSAGTSNPKN